MRVLGMGQAASQVGDVLVIFDPETYAARGGVVTDGAHIATGGIADVPDDVATTLAQSGMVRLMDVAGGGPQYQPEVPTHAGQVVSQALQGEQQQKQQITQEQIAIATQTGDPFAFNSVEQYRNMKQVKLSRTKPPKPQAERLRAQQAKQAKQ